MTDIYKYQGDKAPFFFTRNTDRQIDNRLFSLWEMVCLILEIGTRDIAAWLYTEERALLVFDDEPDKYYRGKIASAVGS